MRYWELVLKRDWPFPELIKPPVIKSLPDILTQAEVVAVLNQVHEPRFRVFLFTVYSMGLRLDEALHLKPGDIDAQLVGWGANPNIPFIREHEVSHRYEQCSKFSPLHGLALQPTRCSFRDFLFAIQMHSINTPSYAVETRRFRLWASVVCG